MICKVGDDDFGKEIVRNFKECGVDTKHVTIAEGSSGIASIYVTDDGYSACFVFPMKGNDDVYV